MRLLIVSAHGAGFAALPAAEGCPVGRKRDSIPLAGLAFFVRTEHAYILATDLRIASVCPLFFGLFENRCK